MSLTQYILHRLGLNFETIIGGEVLSIPTQCHTFVIYAYIATATLVRKHVSVNSILFENKHHYRKIRSFEIFYWLLHRP